MCPEEETIRLEFSNETERNATLVLFYGPAIVLPIVMGLIFKQYLLSALKAMAILLLLVTILRYIAFKFGGSWNKPDIFIITSDTLKCMPYSNEQSDIQVHLPTVTKLIFKNRLTKKRICMYHYIDGKEWLTCRPRRPFDDCSEKWEQLFEEIKKRIPPDAEVIVNLPAASSGASKLQ